MADEADYVVVGAGSAGCIVANRLAETGAQVILVEAGGSDRSQLVRRPGMITAMHSVPQLKKLFDWNYYTVPQENAMQRQIPTVRGKLLGGSSSVNGMIFVRGNRADYDNWAADGCTGWSYDEVLPSFKRMEDWEGGSNELRGSGGPIAVSRQRDLPPPSRALNEAISDFFEVDNNVDYNGATQTGVSPLQMSARSGKRFNTSRAYLTNRPNPNLRTRTKATVSRVVIEGGKATGVEVLDGNSTRTIRAKQEVVLAGGVIGSPQLLMLSGVGPSNHLGELGIKVQADLPVGENLHDHLFVPMTFLAPEAGNKGTAAYFMSGMAKEMLRGDTWVGRTAFDSVGFVPTGQAGDYPDLQLHTMPWSYPSPNQDAPVRHSVDTRPAMTIMPTLIHPKSRGELRLSSADPRMSPVIDPAYLSDPADTRFLLDGIKMTRELMRNKYVADFLDGELHPGPDTFDDAELARQLPNRVHSVYHPVGTCRMGADERAVVDPQLRVRGVEGLRVADASIIPDITSGNTNAPAMMIGERCAELMTS